MSNNKKLSSIEWLLQEALQWNVDIRDNSQFIQFPSGAIEQAKTMHNKEMKEMYLKGIENYDPTFQRKDNETFGDKEL